MLALAIALTAGCGDENEGGLGIGKGCKDPSFSKDVAEQFPNLKQKFFTSLAGNKSQIASGNFNRVQAYRNYLLVVKEDHEAALKGKKIIRWEDGYTKVVDAEKPDKDAEKLYKWKICVAESELKWLDKKMK